MIFNNAILVAIDLSPSCRSIQMICAYKQWRAPCISSSLDDAMKDISLFGRRMRNEVFILVAIYLWSNNEPHVRVSEVAKCSFKEIGKRYVVWVHLPDNIVFGFMQCS